MQNEQIRNIVEIVLVGDDEVENDGNNFSAKIRNIFIIILISSIFCLSFYKLLEFILRANYNYLYN